MPLQRRFSSRGGELIYQGSLLNAGLVWLCKAKLSAQCCGRGSRLGCLPRGAAPEPRGDYRPPWARDPPVCKRLIFQ